MAEELRIGTARLLVASAITDPVEDWKDLGVTRGDVVFTPESGRYAMGRSDQKGRTPTADSVYDLGVTGQVTAPLLDRELAKLNEWFPGAVLVSDSGNSALGLGSGTSKLTPKAFALVPEADYTAGEAWWDSAFTVWMPKAIAVVVGPATLNLPEGDDVYDGVGFEVEFRQLTGGSGLSANFREGGFGSIWLGAVGVLGLDFLWETDPDGVDTLDTELAPLIGGTGTFTRASSATTWTQAGVLQSAGNDVARFEALGILIEPQRTNKCTRQYLHAGAITGWVKGGDAAAILTAVTDATELANAGLDTVVSDDYVLKLDNSGGAASAFAANAGQVGNLNPHTLSAYVRGGTGNISMNGIGAENFAALAAYGRVFARNKTPTLTTLPLRLTADAGEIVYFVLAQLEEGEYETSVILNSGDSSVTRNADAWSFALAQAIDPANGVSAQVDFTPLWDEANVTTTNGLFMLGDATDPRLALGLVSGVWTSFVDDGVGGLDSVALSGETFPAGVVSEATLVWDTALADKVAAFDGDTDVSGTGITQSPPAGTWGGLTLHVGSHNGSEFGGHISRLAISRGNRAALQLRKLKRAS